MTPLDICRSAPLSWGLCELEDGELKEIEAGGLVQLVGTVTDRLHARRPEQAANFTFTSRFADNIVANPDPQDMHEASAAFAAQRARGVVPPVITVLCPLGDPDQPGLWAQKLMPALLRGAERRVRLI